MPVTNTNSKKDRNWTELRHMMHMNEFAHKIFLTLFAILLVYLVVWVGTMIRNNIQAYTTIGRSDRAERVISFNGEGKVTAAPDTAMTTIGMVASGKTVAEAQAKNTLVMNRLIEKLQTLGIEPKDMQTSNYNLYPKYNYTEDKGQILEGYELSQSVTVKIRDLNKANAVLGLVGEVGANSVSGLSFVIDDPEVYRAQARELAIQKVMQKANGVSSALGVRFTDIVSYDEYDGGAVPPMPYYAERSLGYGGDIPKAEPTVMGGSFDIVVNVTVGFAID